MTKFDDLEKLAKLKEQGVITDAEFQAQKQAILADTTATPSGKMIPMGAAYKSYWKKSFVWSGRATRAEYWWPCLCNFLIGLGLSVLDLFGLGILYTLFYIATIFPGLAVTVRRFHDLGKSAWFACTPYLLLLASVVLVAFNFTMTYFGTPAKATGVLYIIFGITMIITAIVWFVFLLLPGQKCANKYGEPK